MSTRNNRYYVSEEESLLGKQRLEVLLQMSRAQQALLGDTDRAADARITQLEVEHDLEQLEYAAYSWKNSGNMGMVREGSIDGDGDSESSSDTEEDIRNDEEELKQEKKLSKKVMKSVENKGGSRRRSSSRKKSNKSSESPIDSEGKEGLERGSFRKHVSFQSRRESIEEGDEDEDSVYSDDDNEEGEGGRRTSGGWKFMVGAMSIDEDVAKAMAMIRKGRRMLKKKKARKVSQVGMDKCSGIG